MKSAQITAVWLVCLGLIIGVAGPAAAAELSGEDQAIIAAGVAKAKELKANPVPLVSDKTGKVFIPKGYKFSIRNGRFSIAENDMLINATAKKITLAGTELQRGEYAVVKEGKVVKGEASLLPKK